jgi:pentalenolactone synthase
MRSLPFHRPDPLGPPPEHARLRAITPVARVRAPDGQPAWLVTSYDAVAQVLSDRRFGLTPPGFPYEGNDTLFQDGEAHSRLRRLVSGAFGPRRLTALRPRVEQLATGLVRDLARSGPPADLVEGFAAPLSIAVIGELLGVAIGDLGRFRALADAASGADFLFGGTEEVAAAMRAHEDLAAYAAELIAAGRREPAARLLGELIAVRDADDGRLGDHELVAMVTTIVSAGYLSACNAVSAGAVRLLAEGRLADLADAGQERAGAIVEEVLRLQSGRTGEPFPRFAQEDMELAGMAIGAGDMILVRLEAAHRDPDHYAAPDRFNPDRFAPGRVETDRVEPRTASAPSMVFGQGPHYCLGAALARVEVGVALTALARELPGLRLRGAVEEIEWTAKGVDLGPAAVHVTWA